MRIRSEKEILDPKIRAMIIEEIEEREEQRRRDQAYMRHQCYRDQTRRFVIESLLNQFEQTTVNQMEYAISNISIVKKVIDKLARVYSLGAERTIVESKDLTSQLQELCDYLNCDTQMKLVNRLLKLQRNTALYVKPCPYEMDGVKYWGVKLEPMSPHLYSVVEDYYDRTRPMAYVLSNYEQRVKYRVSLEPSKEGRTYRTPQPNPVGDRKDDIIADTPEDQGASYGDKDKRYIFWTNSFHFTTNGKGAVIDKDSGNTIVNPGLEQIENPIGELPFEDFGVDRDGTFWSYGGDDLIDGSILVNCLISNLNHIAVTQGYGQMVMTGKDLPNNVLIGPDKVIKLEHTEDDPQPSVQFLTANAPLSQLQDLVEMYVALLLTTNNLSTTGISMQLQGTSTLASGVALMIDKAESQEDVRDQRQIFLDAEPNIFRKVNKWIGALREDPEKVMDPRLEDIRLPEGFETEMQVNFTNPTPLMSEGEHLDNLKKRKELGISTMVDLIKKDQPDLNDDEAREKLKNILEEKLERANSMFSESSDTEGADNAREGGGSDLEGDYGSQENDSDK